MNIAFNEPDLTDKRCLVLGGRGFIGSHLAERLALRHGAIVGVLSRNGNRQSTYADSSRYIELVCDLRNLEQTIDCFQRFKPNFVFQFAAHPDASESVSQVTQSFQANAYGTLHALEAFRLVNGELFVYGDSCKVFGNSPTPFTESTPIDPISSYAISKAAGWQYCNLYKTLYDCNVVSVRPTLVYGPGQAYNLFSFVVDCVRQKKEIQLSGGSQTRDPLYIDDLINAVVAVIQKRTELKGRVINVGGGSEYSVYQLTAIALELIGADLPIIVNDANVRPTEMQRSWCDNYEAGLLLDWRPATDFITGLSRTIAEIAKAGYR